MPAPQEILIIHKGEQFIVPFDVTIGDDKVTPENIDGLRFKIGGRMCEWPGELEYDNENEEWHYPLTEEQTLSMPSGGRPAQVAVKIGDDILKTDIFSVTVKESTITERWAGGD